MSVLIPNSFSAYDLLEEEILQGSLLTITQKQVLQNHLAAAAEEKLVLEFDVTSPQDFIQQEAYKKGQLDTFRFLLDQSDAAQETLNFANGVIPEDLAL